jgi:hypothetical protein
VCECVCVCVREREREREREKERDRKQILGCIGPIAALRLRLGRAD